MSMEQILSKIEFAKVLPYTKEIFYWLKIPNSRYQQKRFFSLKFLNMMIECDKNLVKLPKSQSIY